MALRVCELSNYDYKSAAQAEALRRLVYERKLVVLKNMHLGPRDFLELARGLGTPEVYYEPMYHHPEFPEIFVSSSVAHANGRMGVPQTGRFWHTDYAFTPRPFAMTLVYPTVIPASRRGTCFVDMGQVYASLPEDLKQLLQGTRAEHSGRNYYKIRPADVYRPIRDIVAEIEARTPPALHPTVVTHPVTKELVLFISAAFTQRILREDGTQLDDAVLERLFEHAGQLSQAQDHPFIHFQPMTKGDLLIWDNRSLAHCAAHAPTAEPTETLRITTYDDHALSAA
jgi:alpha-ketoglutarate-dependent taurine dioxygenase